MITDDFTTLLGPQYAALADTLAAAPPAIADGPSRCAGWAVRHVVAHLTMPARYDEQAFGRELAAAGYDFAALSETIARRDAERPFTDLLSDLRSDVLAGWVPPQGGPMGALSHVVIHGLDVTTANALPRSADDRATRIVLDQLADPATNPFGAARPGVRFRATDLDWTFGEGEPCEDTAGELLLLLAGRQPRRVANDSGR